MINAIFKKKMQKFVERQADRDSIGLRKAPRSRVIASGRDYRLQPHRRLGLNASSLKTIRCGAIIHSCELLVRQ